MRYNYSIKNNVCIQKMLFIALIIYPIFIDTKYVINLFIS